MMKQVNPEVRAALLAASWSQAMGLPLGNYWEGPVSRNVVSDVQRLGGGERAWAMVEKLYEQQLGLAG